MCKEVGSSEESVHFAKRNSGLVNYHPKEITSSLQFFHQLHSRPEAGWGIKFYSQL